MSAFLAFTSKEIKEQVKTFKGVAVAAVMLIFGMMSPLMAKMMPDIFKSMGTGIKIEIPTPTYLDSYAQFFKNIGQMGIIVFMLIFAGVIASELQKGTAIIVLTKRLSRTGFVLSKYCGALFVWTVSYAASAALCVVYTVYLFPDGKPQNLFISLLCMWLFGAVVLAGAVFSSVVFKNYPLAALGTFAIWGLMLITAAFPKIEKYSPAFLGNSNLSLMSGTLTANDALIPAAAGIVFAAVLLVSACAILRAREL